MGRLIGVASATVLVLVVGAFFGLGAVRQVEVQPAQPNTLSSIDVTATTSYSFTPNIFQQVATNSTIPVSFTDASSLSYTFTIIGVEGWVVPRTYSSAQILALAYGSAHPNLVNINVSGSGTVSGSFTSPGPGWYEFLSTEAGQFQLGMYGFVAFGENLPANLTTSPREYVVSFTENGLPSGTNWSVSLNESTRSSVSSTITFEEANGSYLLHTWDVKGYLSYANLTTLNVTGAPIGVVVYYNAPAAGTYFVTFVQSGLPLNVIWEVQLSAIINGTTGPGGISQNYFGPTHTLAGGISGVENGTFEWTAYHLSLPEWPIASYYPFPSSGMVIVNGSSVLIHLTYRYSYPFAFDVEGVPASVPVTLQIPNETVTGTGPGGYLVMIPNGTYSWNATAPGYQTQNGTVSVQGMPESNVREVSFQTAPSTSSPPWAWIEIAVVAAVIVIGAAVFLLGRRKGGSRIGESEASTAPSSPPPTQQPPSPPL